MTQPPDEQYNFFVSFASPDRNQALQLHDALVNEGYKVFYDEHAIPPGDPFSDVLASALRATEVVIALLSEHTKNAEFQKEELAFAGRNRRRIVPVYLDGIPREPPDWAFGWLTRSAIDLPGLGQAEAIRRLKALVGDREMPAEEGASAGGFEPYPGLAYLHGAALRLNRIDQWYPVHRACEAGESRFFLLHGPRQQNVDLFLDRMRAFLHRELGFGRFVVNVPLRNHYSKPRSKEEWLTHLQVGLAEFTRRSGTAEALLRAELDMRPVFLVLCGRAIEEEDLEDEVERDAFCDLLDDGLPKLMARTATGRNPVFAMLALHYRDRPTPFVGEIDQLLDRSSRRHGIAYRPLPELKPPEWNDIREYLLDLPNRPPRRVFDEIEKRFHGLSSPQLEYREIAEMLDRWLG